MTSIFTPTHEPNRWILHTHTFDLFNQPKSRKINNIERKHIDLQYYKKAYTRLSAQLYTRGGEIWGREKGV